MELIMAIENVCPTFISVNNVVPSNGVEAQNRMFPDLYQPIVLVEQMSEITELEVNVSVFDRELYPPELTCPTAVGVHRHAPHCSVVIFHVSSTLLTFSTLEWIITRKIVRINHDIFIFRGHQKVLNALKVNYKLRDIPLKHFIYPDFDPYGDRVVNFCKDENLLTARLLLSTKPCLALVKRKHILVAAVPSPSWYRPADPPGKGPSGSYYVMLKEASKRLNFTFSIRTLTATGTKVHGKWTGAMGAVLYRRAHVALTNALSDSRYSAVEGAGFLCWVNRVFWVRLYRGNQGAGSIL